jgi:hypothetical protein
MLFVVCELTHPGGIATNVRNVGQEKGKSSFSLSQLRSCFIFQNRLSNDFPLNL